MATLVGRSRRERDSSLAPIDGATRAATDEEIAEGYVLTCQSVPKGEGVAVDYDS